MLIGVISMLALLFVLLLGVPIAFSLALVGFAGLTYFFGIHQALAVVYMTPYSSVASWLLIVVPLFILMGFFASTGGLVESIFNAAHKWLGHIRGGLAMATVVGCAFFGAASGSSVACTAVFGKIAVPEMEKYGYQTNFAMGCVAIAGTLDALIPPSLGFVIYGIVTEQSIGKLLIAGIMPGILTAATLMLFIWARVKINPQIAPTIEYHVAMRERIASLKGCWGLMVLIVAVMGTIYAGIATPTEAAALGAFAAFLLSLFSRKMTLAGLKESLMETTRTTSMLFIIIVGAKIYTCFLTLSGFTSGLSSWIVESNIPPVAVLCCIYVIYLILGCFLDPMGMMLITVPIFYPILVTGFGYNPIWFGVMVVKLIELGMLTPPVGMHVYVLKSLFPKVPIEQIFSGCGAFVLLDLFNIAILTLFPEISLWLPSKM